MMIEFCIKGNQDNILGNPIPKLKMTGRQRWTPKARRYSEWKRYITRSFLLQIAESYGRIPETMQGLVYPIRDEKVIVIPKNMKAYMDIYITWANDKRGDPENIFGSIADALFWDDKNLCGSFDFSEEKGEPSVLVRISI